MIFTILGCGETAAAAQRRGVVIGSNDCEKYGLKADHLVLADIPGKFTHDRLATIKRTKAKVHVHNYQAWAKIFPAAELLRRFIEFPRTRVRREWIYHSMTTPIISCSLALNAGAEKLVLYGVDMKTHRVWAVSNKRGYREYLLYLDFFKLAKKHLGVETYIGSLGTAFDGDLPLYI